VGQENESIGAIGEFGLIDRIQRIVGPSEVGAGIGDDAAVIDSGGPEVLLATVDMLVEDVHFRPDMPALELGRRCIAVNVSDVAAMGGTPRYALVSLALRRETSTTWVEELYRGMMAEALASTMDIVGGNLTRTAGPLCIDVILLGSVPRGEVVLRSGGRVGDLLAVTGTLGDAAALRAAREQGLDLTGIAEPGWIDQAARVHPRVREGRALATARLAHAMLDLSDGLAGDLEHLCWASGVGAEIEAHHVPISPEVRAIADLLDLDPLTLALAGGEDYELLVALGAGGVARAAQETPPVHLHVLGRLVPRDEGICLVDRAGKRHPIETGAWRHF
jgi:thiamine-monophosphate kinase